MSAFSEVEFLHFDTVKIKYRTCDLDEKTKKILNEYDKERKFHIDLEKLFLFELNQKNVVMLYNVNSDRFMDGLMSNEMCMITQDLGFIISSLISRGYPFRIKECYYAVKEGHYISYFDIEKMNEGIIYFIIKYGNKFSDETLEVS